MIRPRTPRFTAPIRHAHDNQATLVPQVLAERRRRELWLHCERAPIGREFG